MGISRSGLSVHAVYPVKDDEGVIGSFDITMGFSSVLSQTKINTGFDSGIFIDDKLMADVAKLVPRPDSEKIVGGYQAIEVTDWAAIKPLRLLTGRLSNHCCRLLYLPDLVMLLLISSQSMAMTMDLY